MSNNSKPEFLDTKQAAEFLGGLSPVTLNTWRSTKRYDLPYIKVGGKVRYRLEELIAFLESRTRRANAT